jgi:hypothetical protein
MILIILHKIKNISFFTLLLIFLNISTSKAEVNYNQLNELNKEINDDILDLYFLLSIGDMLNISFENMQDLILDIHNNKNSNQKLQSYNQENTLALIFDILKNEDLPNEISNNQCNNYTKHCDTLNILFNNKADEIKKNLEDKYKNLGLTMEDLKTLIIERLNRL